MRVIIIMSVGSILMGCTSLQEPQTGSVSTPVIGGEPAFEDTGVVLVVEPNRQGCTGIVLSRRVVLTASYCASVDERPEVRVLTGPELRAPQDMVSAYIVSEVIPIEGASDLSLLVLEEGFALDESTVYDVASDGHPSLIVGEPVRFIGYGNTIADDNSSAGLRSVRSGVITSVGTINLEAEVGVCYGDAGGPLLDQDDIVLGIAVSTETQSCEEDSVFTRVDHVSSAIMGLIDSIDDTVSFGAEDLDGDQQFMARGAGCSTVAVGSRSSIR